MSMSTDCAHAGEGGDRSESVPSGMPIYQTSVYDFPDLQVVDEVWEGQKPGYIYGRFGLPNTTALETVVARLEKAEAGLASASGMGSIVAALWALLEAGDELIVGNDLYGGTLSLAIRDFTRFGITARSVQTTNLQAIEATLTSKSKVLLVETLSNPQLNVIDVPGIAEICRKKGVKLLVDNTTATPFLICPLTMGADVVIHSATKFLGGHHDVTAGIVTGSREFIARAREVAIRLGASLSPFDAWLTVRGIKTFALRMERICANAQAVAQYLSEHPKIKRVYYAGLETHPQFDLVRRTMKGLGGGMLSFDLCGDLHTVESFVMKLRMIRFAPSFGGLTTTISHPAKTSHRSLTPQQRSDVGISDTMVRLSAGIEDAGDIKEDLQRALESS